MSTSYSVFTKKGNSTDAVKAALEAILNTELKRVDTEKKELYSAELLGLSFDLWTSFTYGDHDIKFSEYSHEIIVNYRFGSFDIYYKSDWERLTSIVIASMMTNSLSCETIVVEDAQKIIETFPP